MTIEYDSQWGMKDNGECQTMVDGTQWWMIDNEE